MTNTVIAIKKSSTPGTVPGSGIMSNGELAINFSDGKLYYKHANGNVYAVNANVDNFGIINVNGTLVVADGPTDILSVAPADATIVITADDVNDRITIGANLKSVFDKANTTWTYAANSVMLTANSAFAKANSDFANTSGTLEGDLTVKGQLVTTSNLVTFGTSMRIEANGAVYITGGIINML